MKSLAQSVFKLAALTVLAVISLPIIVHAQGVNDFVINSLDVKYNLTNEIRPGNDTRYSLDGTKLKNMGWEAPKNLESSLEKTILWTIKYKEKWLKELF